MKVRAVLYPDDWTPDGREEVVLRLAPDAMLQDAVEAALAGAVDIAEARHFVRAEIDGVAVPAELWTGTPAPPAHAGRELAFTLQPRGRVLRSIVQVAIVVAAAYIAGPAVFGLEVGSVAYAAATAAITVGGTLAFNAIFPAPTPQLGGAALPQERSAGPERQVASQAANRARPYGRRSLVLGAMRIEPDLATAQLAVPAATAGGADTDRTSILPGATAASLAPRLDRIMLLDLGIGRLAYGAEAPGYAVGAGGVVSAGLGTLLADSIEIDPYYLVEPGGPLAPPAARGAGLAVPESAAWPLRVRAARLDTDPLSGATVEIDSTRGGTRLLLVVGGLLYSSSDAGALQRVTSRVTVTGEDPAGQAADAVYGIDLSGASLTPGYAALELAAGTRDWKIAGGARSTTTRSRVDLSVAGSYWLAPLADLAARRLPTTLLAVRLRGAVGAPPRRIVRAVVGQRVAVPNAAGAWTGSQVSRNPAALLRAFALGFWDTAARTGGGPAPTGALLAGTGRPMDTIDHDSLAAFYRRCEAHDPPLRCDLWLQDDGRPADAVERLIAACGRAEISWRTGRLGVVWSELDDAPQGLIAPANTLPGSLSIAWKGATPPDEIVATWFDRTDWQPKEMRVAVPGRTGAARERQIRIEGVTEEAAVRFHTAAAAAEEAFHRRVVTFRMGRAGARMSRGDVWLMAADLLSGGLTGRLRALGEREIALDRAVRVGARTWIALDVPGAPLHQCAVLAAPGEAEITDRLLLADPHPALASRDVSRPRDAVWRLYDLDLPPRPVRIVANRPVSASEFEITARDERREYWEFLDRFRADSVTPRDPATLPDGVTLRGDQTWNWPQAWTDLGFETATMLVIGAGGGGRGGASRPCKESGFNDEGFSTSTNYAAMSGAGGGAGGVTTVSFGDMVLTVEGNAASGGTQAGTVGIGRNFLIRAADGPFIFDFGMGGVGGAGGRSPCSFGGNGQNGADAFAMIYPLIA